MFKDKTVIVTGASKGIGLGIVLAFAQNGASVVLADIDGETNENSAKETENKTGSKCLAITCDVSKKDDVENLVKNAEEKFGSVDILVNNAGIYPFKPFMDLTEEDWDKIMDINLKSMFLTSQAVARKMKENDAKFRTWTYPYS